MKNENPEGGLIAEFFLPMREPPSVTHQEKKVAVVAGKLRVYEPPRLKEARSLLLGSVAKYRPREPADGPLRLVTKWVWPEGKGRQGWKATRPDTDNLVKLLKDCMTKAGFWKDDAQVASEVTEKFYGGAPGIYVRVDRL